MEPVMSDQRREERVPLRLIVEYEDAEDFIGDYTDNLSTGGTFILTNRVLERESTVELVLSFPGLLQPICLAGIVRWVRAGAHPGVGVEFLPGHDHDKLAELVEAIRRGDSATLGRVVHVLVAEDNRHVAELLCSGLGASAKRFFTPALTFRFATAATGASALELLRHTAFDVAIVAVYLPVLDGPHVIAQARHDLGLVDLPIIAISTGGAAARTSALEAGANMFLDKPMRLRDVLDSMRRLVPLSA
jgi:uncharacterized protein (TIGR02266 family)